MSSRHATDSMSGIARTLGFVILTGLALGCSHLGPGISGKPCPVAWEPTQSIATANASLRARIELKVLDEQINLELVAQGQSDEIIVVGLARFGVRLFALHQRGTDVRVSGARDFELEQVALWIMDALHRAVWISPPPDQPLEGPIRWSRSGEQIQQSRIGSLTRRSFFDLDSVEERDDDVTPRVTIDYLRPPNSSGDRAGSFFPQDQHSITIHNPWCGYDATIVPL